MEENEESRPQRGDTVRIPEKPLEVERSKKEAKKKTSKSRPSKFKSIFTKSSRGGLSKEKEGSEGLASGHGKGDNRGPSQDALLMVAPAPNTNPGEKSLLPKNPSAFMAGGVGGGGGESQEQLISTKNITASAITSSSSSDDVVADKVQNPEPVPQPISQQVAEPKERKKEVTIAEVHDEPPQQRRKREKEVTSKRSVSGSGMRNVSNKVISRDSRAHLKMRNKELCGLVEELTRNCEHYRYVLRHRQFKDEKEKFEIIKENETLNLEICKLSQEIDEWRDRCQKMENKSTALSKARALTKENKHLLEDIEVLKSVICRLNKELAFYQDKLRVKFKSAPENLQTYSTSSGTSLDDEDSHRSFEQKESSKEWLRSPKTSLQPLLIAYDEALAEKDELIRDHEGAIDKFKARCMGIIKENEDLHKLISDNKDRGSISLEEWESLRANAVLVLEENDLLHDQLTNMKKKEEVMFASFEDKNSKSKIIINQLDTEIRRLRSHVSDLENRCKQLNDDNLNMSATLQSRIPQEKHDATMQEFKLTFEKLKSTYQADRKGLCDKIESLEKEKDRLVEDGAKLQTETSLLREKLKECEKNLVEHTTCLQDAKTELVELKSAKDATNTVIEDFMNHVKILVAEKNKLVEDLNEQKLLNEQIMGIRSQENQLVADLHGKIAEMERLHNAEVRSVQKRMKELEEEIKFSNDRNQNDVMQLDQLVKEKDRRIETIEAEKRQLKQDLETVWRTTTTTMQTTLKSRNT